MIHFKTVRWMNFMSYGNAWTEMNLDSTKNTLIIGKNGSGKSSVLDAISFALFGKPFRNINKPQLINSITDKNCLVECTFKVGKKEYLIRRGIKPAIFEIFVDGELVKQDSLTKDYQTYLENSVLKINYKSFCQIVVLGSSNYVPFMQLPAHARRMIIEDLLDLQVFSTMNILLKERVNENKDHLLSSDQNIKVLQSNLSLHESHLKTIQTDLKEQTKNLKQKIKEEQTDVKKVQDKLKEFSDVKQDLLTKLTKFAKYDEMYGQLNEYISKFSKNIQTLNKELQFYNSSCECPTCKQSIEEKFKNSVVDQCNKKILKNNESITTAQEKLEKVKNKLVDKSKVIEKIKTVDLEYNKLFTESFAKIKLIESYQSDLENLKVKVDNVDVSKKIEFEKNLELAKAEKQILVESKEVLSVASQLLKDGGIKTLIIKQYIPVMNKIINQYLNHMNFFIEFSLDDNFNETIKSRHRDDFSYESFSEGEKSRINLAILFAWRAIAKMRNTASTNLLIFDEIFDGSLDGDGTDDFMKILNTLTGDTNVFIISHKTDQISDKFDSVIKFEKVKNFSKMEIL